jgi:fructosamine-3-kinase
MDVLTVHQRSHIERAVSGHLGRPWAIAHVRDMREFASHPSAILSDADGAYAVFVKRSQAANAHDQFEREMAGLRLLTERSGALTPAAIGLIEEDDGAMMILEAVEEVERTTERWRDIGRALARVHRAAGLQCGLETNGYFGPLYQDNRPVLPDDWPTFYAERRLWPRLMGAIDSGHLPSDVIRQVERLIQRLPLLCGSCDAPALLHGDAHKNNYISTAHGAVIIDPAPYYGNPEFDLALLDYFEPVPEDVFDGYREEMPIAPGFAERRDLWRIYSHLGIVMLGEVSYLDRLVAALRQYA